MRRSSKSFLFPDVNVWIALAWGKHVHHPIAAAWFGSLGEEAQLAFCRITQISFLRLLTTEAVMGSSVLSHAQAWQTYDRWVEDSRIVFLSEPEDLERAFRSQSHLKRPSPKHWADAYLLAFTAVAGLQLVTFDRALRLRNPNAVLLGD
jgi:toxin-antitoxin system PIN domain toxin